MRQTSDQLVNFRALASEVQALRQEVLKKEMILRGLVSDVGMLMVKPDPAPAAAAPAGSANAVEVVVDFGSSFTHFAETVVTGETWVTVNSKIAVTPIAATGATVETALLSFHPVVHTLVAGTGFTLSVYTPIEAKGTYSFSCVGVD